MLGKLNREVPNHCPFVLSLCLAPEKKNRKKKTEKNVMILYLFKKYKKIFFIQLNKKGLNMFLLSVKSVVELH